MNRPPSSPEHPLPHRYRVVGPGPADRYFLTERGARTAAALDPGGAREAPPVVEVYDPGHPAAFGGWRLLT